METRITVDGQRTKMGGKSQPDAPGDNKSTKRSLEPKKFDDIELDNSEEKMLPITFQEFFQNTNIENLVKNEIKKSRKNSYAAYINDKAYVHKLARRSYLHFYTKPTHRKSEPFKYIQLCSECPASVKDRFMDIPEQYQRSKKSDENESKTKKPTDIESNASNDKNFYETDDDLRSSKPITSISQKSEQNKSKARTLMDTERNASKGKKSYETEDDLRSPKPSTSKSQKPELNNNIICPPPSFKVFKRFVNFEAEIEKRISACANVKTSCDKNLRSKFERDFYNEFYATPTLRHNFLWTLRPCPRKTKEQILTHVPHVVERNILNENVISKGKSLEEVSQFSSAQPELALEEEIGFKYPISFQLFKRYTYCDKIVDAIFKDIYGNDTVALAEAKSNHCLRDNTFKNYYYGFYKDIDVRKKYKIKLRPCPAHIKDLIMKMPSEKDQKMLNTKDESEISRKRRSDDMEICQLSPKAKKTKNFPSSTCTDTPTSTKNIQATSKTFTVQKNNDAETLSHETTNKPKTVQSPRAVDLSLQEKIPKTVPSLNNIDKPQPISESANTRENSDLPTQMKLLSPTNKISERKSLNENNAVGFCSLQEQISKTVPSSNNIDKPQPISESANTRENSDLPTQMKLLSPTNKISERKSLNENNAVGFCSLQEQISKTVPSSNNTDKPPPISDSTNTRENSNLPTQMKLLSPTNKISERKSLDFTKTDDSKISQNEPKTSKSVIPNEHTTPSKKTATQAQTSRLPTHIVRSSTDKNKTPNPKTSDSQKTIDLAIPNFTIETREQSNLLNLPKTIILPTLTPSHENPNQANNTDNSSRNKPVKIVSWLNAKVLMDYIAKKANNLDRETQISILKKTIDKAKKPGLFLEIENELEDLLARKKDLPVKSSAKQFVEVQSVEIFFPTVNTNNKKQQEESSTSEMEQAQSLTEVRESSLKNLNNFCVSDAVGLNKSYPDNQFATKNKTPLMQSPNILLSSSGSTVLTQSQSLQNVSQTLTATEVDPSVALQSTHSCLSSICSQNEFIACLTSTQKQPEVFLPNSTFSKDPLKKATISENQKELGNSALENGLNLNDHDVKKEPKFLDHLQFSINDSNSEIHVRSLDISQPIIIDDSNGSEKRTTSSNLVELFMNANTESTCPSLQLSDLHASQGNDENAACTFHEAQKMPSSLEESKLVTETSQHSSDGIEVLEDQNQCTRKDSLRTQSDNKNPIVATNFSLARSTEVKRKFTTAKSNRQIDSVPQLTHAFRSLPVKVNKTKPNDQATPSTGSVSNNNEVESTTFVRSLGTASSFSASQALAADCTLFKSSQLLNIIEKEQTSDTDAIVTKATTTSSASTTSSLQQQQVTEQDVPFNNHLHKTILFRHVHQFHYFSSLNEQNIANYELPHLNYGQPYMQAVVRLDNGHRFKIYGANLINLIFPSFSHRNRSDLFYILNDLMQYHYNTFDKKLIKTTADLRERVLYHLLNYAPIFCHCSIKFDCNMREYGQCAPVPSQCNVKRRPSRPLIEALKPSILRKIALVKSQLVARNTF